jgi:hypothetical protein
MAIRSTARVAGFVAFLGLCVMILYFVGGACSPEPDHHPVWMRPLQNTRLWLVIIVLCLPAHYIAHSIAVGLTVELPWIAYIITACFIQVALYFCISFTLAEFYVWVRRGRRSRRRQDPHD